jgi:hypothetical protein
MGLWAYHWPRPPSASLTTKTGSFAASTASVSQMGAVTTHCCVCSWQEWHCPTKMGADGQRTMYSPTPPAAAAATICTNKCTIAVSLVQQTNGCPRLDSAGGNDASCLLLDVWWASTNTFCDMLHPPLSSRVDRLLSALTEAKPSRLMFKTVEFAAFIASANQVHHTNTSCDVLHTASASAI